MSSASIDRAGADVSFCPRTREEHGGEWHTDGVVHRLIDGRSDPSPLFTCDDHLRDLESGEIAQPQLYELALPVQLIDRLQRLREGHAAVRSVQVENVHTVGLQLRQALVQLFFDHLRPVRAWLLRIPFRG